MTVSVCICTFNGAEYVGEQLDSIFRQTVLPDELIWADDGSTDSTAEIVRGVVDSFRQAGRAVQVVVLEPQASPLGFVLNFERALLAASNDYVVLADQDDVWEPRRIEVGLTVFAESPGTQIVACDVALIDEVGRSKGQSLFDSMAISASELRALNSQDALGAAIKRSVLPGMALMARSSFLATTLPVGEGWPHDYWLVVNAAARGGLRVIPDRLVSYRQHQNNVMGVGSRRLVTRLMRLLATGESTADRNVRRFRALLEQLAHTASPSSLDLLRSRLAFEECRAHFSRNRMRRAVQVGRLLVLGDYSYAPNGRLDALRDVIG
jgi:glycosyltransferase involved in cell wall biosynthesis